MSDSISTPREGIHALRIPLLGIALIDTVGTVAAAFIISKVTGWSFVKVSLGLAAISVPVHIYYGVQTALVEKIDHLVNDEPLANDSIDSEE